MPYDQQRREPTPRGKHSKPSAGDGRPLRQGAQSGLHSKRVRQQPGQNLEPLQRSEFERERAKRSVRSTHSTANVSGRHSRQAQQPQMQQQRPSMQRQQTVARQTQPTNQRSTYRQDPQPQRQAAVRGQHSRKPAQTAPMRQRQQLPQDAGRFSSLRGAERSEASRGAGRLSSSQIPRIREQGAQHVPSPQTRSARTQGRPLPQRSPQTQRSARPQGLHSRRSVADTPQRGQRLTRAPQHERTPQRERMPQHERAPQRTRSAAAPARAPQHTRSRTRQPVPYPSVEAQRTQVQPRHTSYRPRPLVEQRSTKMPLVIGIAFGVLVIALIMFAIHSCVGAFSRGGEGDGAEQDSASVQAGALRTDNIVMTLLGDEETIVLQGERYIEAGCHAVDKQAKKDISSTVSAEGLVDTSTEGDYTVTYTATNASGAYNTRTRTVHVVSQMDADTDGIAVMMYHHIYTDDDPPEVDDTNYLHADKLEAQLKWLTENDYYFPSYPELAAYIAGEHSLPKKSVVLTFDDGQMGFFKHGVPLLNKYKVHATSFVIGDRSRTAKAIYKYASEYVTFQSHSYGLHNDGNNNIGRGGRIYDLTLDELKEDSNKMQEMLGGYTAFAYPYGDVSDDAPAALQQTGVLCAFTIEYGNVHPGDDPMRLNRVRVFAESDLDAWIYQVQTGN